MLANAYEIDGANASDPIDAFATQSTTNASSYSGPSQVPSVVGCLAITVTASEKAVSTIPPDGNAYGVIEPTAGPYTASLVRLLATEDTETGITQTITYTGGTGRAIGATILIAPSIANDVPVGVIHSAHAHSDGTTSLDVTVVAPTAGNLLLAAICTDGNTTITPPTGFSLIGNTAQETGLYIWYYSKIAAGTEGTTLTFGLSSSQYCHAVVLEIKNASSLAPINKSGNSNAYNVTTINAPSLTPDVVGVLPVYFVAVNLANRVFSSITPVPWTWISRVDYAYKLYWGTRLRRGTDVATAITNTLEVSATGARLISVEILVAPE